MHGRMEENTKRMAGPDDRLGCKAIGWYIDYSKSWYFHFMNPGIEKKNLLNGIKKL